METRVLTRLFAVVLVLGSCGVVAAQPVRVIYVDDDAAGAGNGSSWADAFNSLQDALVQAALAPKPVEIRVAQGVYKPDQGAAVTPGDQMASFQLLNGVTLKGGYAGTVASDLDVRDIDRFQTVLSGDLRGDDTSTLSMGRDNSCRVVLASLTDASAVLDGFTIAGGGAFESLCGKELSNQGGVVVDGGGPCLHRCRFVAGFQSGLSIRNGGAPVIVGCEFETSQVFTGGSNPVFIDCTFSKGNVTNDYDSNSSLTGCVFESCRTALTSRRGGGATLADCVFRDNEGPAIKAYESDLVLTDCLFERNGRGAAARGGIEAHESDLMLTDCTFVENNGLGIASFGSAKVTMTRCSFIANTGWSNGAVAVWGSAILRDCEFIGNNAQNNAGALHVVGDQLKATGCVFAGNADSQGSRAGAIFAQTTLLLLSNCTFVGNRGPIATMEYWPMGSNSRAEMTHCIIWDGPDPFRRHALEQPRINVTYSDVRGGHPGEGNIDVDPCFVDPGFWADPNDPTIELGPDNPKAVWVSGDYHLKSQAGHWDRESRTWVRDEVTSPCIDAGDPNAPLGSEPFPDGAIVNLGAYGSTSEASKSYFGEPICEVQIAGDLNGDCKVDQTDMDILLSHWLMEGTAFVNTPPTVTITLPMDGQTYEYPTWIPLCAEAADADGSVLQVRFRMRSSDGSKGMAYTDTEPADGWRYDWFWWRTTNVPFEGTFEIWAEALDDDGAVTASPKVKVTLRAGN